MVTYKAMVFQGHCHGQIWVGFNEYGSFHPLVLKSFDSMLRLRIEYYKQETPFPNCWKPYGSDAYVYNRHSQRNYYDFNIGVEFIR